MNTKCDQCAYDAQYEVTGYLHAMNLCRQCAAFLCLEKGDRAGYEKLLGKVAK